MKQFDLIQSIEASLESLRHLTYLDMGEWNYFPSFLQDIILVEQLILDSCGMIPAGYWKPKSVTTATETEMLLTEKLRKEENDFLAKDWK